MAVGGPWRPVDGVDPSIDNNSLIKTALRFMPYDMIIGVKFVFSTAGLMKN